MTNNSISKMDGFPEMLLGPPFNLTDGNYSDDTFIGETYGPPRDPLYVVIPTTIIYFFIFVTGFVGNISTCIVISRNRSMHTATNYYLFSLAISDFILLISGVPNDVYMIWSKYPYVFGETFCVLRGVLAEASANATVLTITAFTVERYVAICHPFLSRTMSKLSRAIRYIFVIWVISITLAVPQAMQFGIDDQMGFDQCLIKHEIIQHSFELSSILFFFTPMILITVLYFLIGMKLRSSTLVQQQNGSTVQRRDVCSARQQTSQGTKRVLKMLVAVVVAFFICWAPFHAQRLVYIYLTQYTHHQFAPDSIVPYIFTVVTYVSGILYNLSTCINPILYNLMSNKFRQAFKETMASYLKTERSDNEDRSYRHLSRGLHKRRGYGRQNSSDYSGTSNRDESCISSSTHKQSLDTIALSRNSSLKSNQLDSKRSELLSSSHNSKFACDCGLHEVHLNIYNKEFTRKARKSNKIKPNLSDIHDTSDELSPTSLNVSFNNPSSTLNISICSTFQSSRPPKPFPLMPFLSLLSHKNKHKQRYKQRFYSPPMDQTRRCLNHDHVSNSHLMVSINNASPSCDEDNYSVNSLRVKKSDSFDDIHCCDEEDTKISVQDDLSDYMKEIKLREHR